MTLARRGGRIGCVLNLPNKDVTHKRKGEIVATKSAHLALDLDDALHKRLQQAAERHGLRVKDFCIQALEKELALEEGISESADVYVQLLALTRRRRQLESRTIRRKPDSTDFIRQGRGHVDAIDLVSGDELEAYREREYARIVGEIRTPTAEEREASLKALERLAARREQLFQGHTLPGNSADLIREAREERSEHLGQTFSSNR